jgi:hypothetical protein
MVFLGAIFRNFFFQNSLKNFLYIFIFYSPRLILSETSVKTVKNVVTPVELKKFKTPVSPRKSSLCQNLARFRPDLAGSGRIILKIFLMLLILNCDLI